MCCLQIATRLKHLNGVRSGVRAVTVGLARKAKSVRCAARAIRVLRKVGLKIMGLRDDPEAMRKYKREWVAKRRAKFFSDKSCLYCKTTSDLQLHHTDRANKSDHKIWSWAEKRRLAEIEKCIIICKLCHASIHNEEKRRPVKHGTSSAYASGCRCEYCRQAHNEYAYRYTHFGFRGNVTVPVPGGD